MRDAPLAITRAATVGGAWTLARSIRVGDDFEPVTWLTVHVPTAGRTSMTLVVPFVLFSASRYLPLRSIASWLTGEVMVTPPGPRRTTLGGPSLPWMRSETALVPGVTRKPSARTPAAAWAVKTRVG